MTLEAAAGEAKALQEALARNLRESSVRCAHLEAEAAQARKELKQQAADKAQCMRLLGSAGARMVGLQRQVAILTSEKSNAVHEAALLAEQKALEEQLEQLECRQGAAPLTGTWQATVLASDLLRQTRASCG